MFHVGQLVECVETPDPRQWYAKTRLPERGQVYTLRDVFQEPRTGLDWVFVRVEEIVNSPVPTDYGPMEPAFSARYFRPLDDSKIEVFRHILVSPPKEVEPA